MDGYAHASATGCVLTWLGPGVSMSERSSSLHMRDAGGDCSSDGSVSGSGVASRSSTIAGKLSTEVTVSRANVLRSVIKKHCDSVMNLLLGSKELLDKRKTVESAFRACHDAFVELHTAYVSLLGERTTVEGVKIEEIKKAVVDVIREEGSLLGLRVGSQSEDVPVVAQTYAAAVGSKKHRVRLAGGRSVEVPKTTDIHIVPREDFLDRYETSRDIKAALQNAIKPSKIALKVNKIAAIGKKCVKIEAVDPDMDELIGSRELRDVGLMIRREEKMNPRIILHGVPVLVILQICREKKFVMRLLC